MKYNYKNNYEISKYVPTIGSVFKCICNQIIKRRVKVQSTEFSELSEHHL